MHATDSCPRGGTTVVSFPVAFWSYLFFLHVFSGWYNAMIIGAIGSTTVSSCSCLLSYSCLVLL